VQSLVASCLIFTSTPRIVDREDTLTRQDIMIFKAYPEEQRDMRWITITMTSIATLLLICRIYATVRNRGWLGLEDAFVITANVSAQMVWIELN
jgi:hypothetical protein